MRKIRKILKPISVLYGEVVKARNKMYDSGVLKSTEFDIPTIVVGNLSVGGTGKSPMIEYLIRLLQNDYALAVLSRGYKRSSKGFQLADKNSTASQLGDEPMQFYKKFNSEDTKNKTLTVAVDADRVNGIKELRKLKNPPEIILLDDAFQHRKVQGGFNILLTPHNNLYVDDAMLPTGDLRENVEGAKRAQVIVVSKCPDNLDENSQFEITKKLKIDLTQTAYFTTIEYDDFVYGINDKLPFKNLRDYEIVLVTGIAKTKPLTDYLASNNIKFKHLSFKDHHNFTVNDLKTIDKAFAEIDSKKKLILTTEKDYVRTFESDKNTYYLPIKTAFLIPDGMEEKSFKTKIKRYVEQSTANR